MRYFKKYFDIETQDEIMLDNWLLDSTRQKYEIVKPLTRIQGNLKVRKADKLYKHLWK